MQYVTRVCGINGAFVSKFLVCRGEMKGSETLLMLILFEKRLTLHENITPALTVFISLNDEIPAISSWEPGAQPKLARAYYFLTL